jgi:hypothetical protein
MSLVYWKEKTSRLNAEIKVLKEERDRLRELLKYAECPNCDGSGGFYFGNPAQCQYCFERDEALNHKEESKGDSPLANYGGYDEDRMV